MNRLRHEPAGNCLDLLTALVASAAIAVAVMLSATSVRAQAEPDYRDFTLGSPVAKVVQQTNAAPADVERIHERPALVQELRWHIPYLAAGTNEPSRDTVQQIVFSFYDDQLFKMTVDYDRRRVEGMTDSDMVSALTERYGPPIQPLAPRKLSEPVSSAPSASTVVVARWERGDVAVELLRTAFTDGLQLVVSSKRLDNLARTATIEAVRIETAAAPALELARRQRDADDAREAKEKARTANKASFRP